MAELRFDGSTHSRFGAETDGRIYEAEVRIVDLASGEFQPEGGVGEITVREPSMALGYTCESENALAYDKQGFFRMGDVGKIISHDHILVTDRIKDIIIRSGENLSSKEIEDALMSAEAIIEAAVVGVADEKTGEAVFAFVVARDAKEVALSQVDKIIREAGLARQKTPSYVLTVAELPRTASGKVVKHELRTLAKATLASNR
jgi:acyl-CoA synthetase (AMP-forming)/AMP-acid ligase II